MVYNYRRGRARPRPYPFDAVIDGLPVMLLAQDEQDTKLVSQRPPDQSNVVPTDYGEDARNPIFGRVTTWETLHLGIGQRTESGDKVSGRYRYSIGVDNSVAYRPAMPGPDITEFTPSTRDAANPVNRFFDLGGSIYWLNGRYLIRRDNDAASTAVQDLGATKIAKDVAVFGPNSGTTTYAYIAMGDADNIWRYDGTTASQHASLKATAFCVRGTDLHRSLNTNQVSTVDINSDPWTAANWRADNQYYIGDKSSSITRMVSMGSGATGPGGSDYLVVFKTDGIYSLNDAGEDAQYLPFMKSGVRSDNGEATGAFGNDQYVRMGETLWKLTPTMQGEPKGPEIYGTLDPLLQGRITAFAGHGSFHAYAGLYNHVDDASYLMKFGAHVENKEGPQVGVYEAWHGSISQPFDGKRITALHKTSIGAPADHTRLYIGFSDGTIAWFTLPCVPDPGSCSVYRFTTTEGYTVLSNWQAGFRGNDKLLLNATVNGEDLSGVGYARLSFDLDLTEAYTDFSSPFDMTPREVQTFPDNSVGTTLSLRLHTFTSDNTIGPKVTSVSIRWRLQIDLQQVYTMLVAAHDHLKNRDGTPLRYGAHRIRDHLRTAVSDSNPKLVILPDETTKTMSFVDIQERLGWDGRHHRWLDAVQVTAVEESTAGTYGTYARLNPLTYADLNGKLYEDLNDL